MLVPWRSRIPFVGKSVRLYITSVPSSIVVEGLPLKRLRPSFFMDSSFLLVAWSYKWMASCSSFVVAGWTPLAPDLPALGYRLGRSRPVSFLSYSFAINSSPSQPDLPFMRPTLARQRIWRPSYASNLQHPITKTLAKLLSSGGKGTHHTSGKIYNPVHHEVVSEKLCGMTTLCKACTMQVPGLTPSQTMPSATWPRHWSNTKDAR